MPESSQTSDSLLHGRLILRQPAHGCRVNLDAVLLAAFAATARPARAAGTPLAFAPQHHEEGVNGHGTPFPDAADLGAGTGAVGLLLRRALLVDRCLLVEAEPALAALAEANIQANGMQAEVAVWAGDLRHALPHDALGRCDLVVANPPYVALAAGRASPDALRAAARHELRGGLSEFAAAAGRLLRPTGTFALIYPWRRRAFARETLRAAGFAIARERRHVPRDGATPTTFCLEARSPDGAPGAEPALEQLVVHEPGRRFSELVERFLDGDYRSAPRIAASSTAPGRTMR